MVFIKHVCLLIMTFSMGVKGSTNFLSPISGMANAIQRARFFSSTAAKKTSFQSDIPQTFPGNKNNGHFAKGHRVVVTCSDSLAFVHVYKAGGTAISAWMSQICDPPKHWNTMIGFEKNVPSPLLQQTYFIFSVIRDPVERYVSAIEEIAARQRFMNHTGPWRYDRQPPEEWVTSSLDKIEQMGRFWNMHLVPQHVFLYDHNGTALPINMLLLLEDGNIPEILNLMSKLYLGTSAEMLDSRGPGSEMSGISLKEAIKVSKRDKQRICKFYRDDYELFDLLHRCQQQR